MIYNLIIMALVQINYQIISSSSQDSSLEFIQYLSRPLWFKRNFGPLFDLHRKKTKGKLFLAKDSESQDTIGCVYCELKPFHNSYGKQIPIFGWLQADTEEICHALLSNIWEFVQDNNFDCLRGPINTPSIYGGWGVRTEGFSNKPLVNSATNSEKLANWISNAGWDMDTEYVSVCGTKWDSSHCSFPNIELKSFPISELKHNTQLLTQLSKFVENNFVQRLPDTTGENKMMRMFNLLDNLERGEEFYVIAFDRITGEIAGAILEIPNIFDLWQNKPISSADIDTAIISKKYRNANLFLWMYFKFQEKLIERGVKTHIGATIWKKNLPAMKCFLKGSYKIANFEVFQMKKST